MPTQLVDRDSIPKLLSELSIKEKANLLSGRSYFRSSGLEKHGIPSLLYLDGGTGPNYMQLFVDLYRQLYRFSDGGDLPVMIPVGGSEEVEGANMGEAALYIGMYGNPDLQACAGEKLMQRFSVMQERMKEIYPPDVQPGCFPPGMILGATWDKETVYDTASALGKEADFYKIDMLFGSPNVNIHRDPLNGRLFEGYSEDPYLVSQLAPEFVRGVQDEGIIGNVKHFAANNQETNRVGINEHISERALREIYFPGFKACLDAGCKSIMSAYNAINGKCSAMNPWLLRTVLRDDWGYEGVVISDWGAAYEQVPALLAGNDVDMPGPHDVSAIVAAVENGEVPEQLLDEAVTRLLEMTLDAPAFKGHRYDSIDEQFSQSAAYNAVKEGAVLLKNNGILPLSTNAKVSFFGDKSKKYIECGCGSAQVITKKSTNVYDSTVELIGSNNVSFNAIGHNTDAVIITVGVIGREGFDRADMFVDSQDQEVLKTIIPKAKAMGKPVIVILNTSGPIDMRSFIEDVDAILCVFIPGMEGGRATADILLGRVNPSGKLPLTFPKRYKDSPTSITFPGRGKETWYGEDIFVGYRYYDYREVEPQFPFGYGLSYTNFAIQSVSMSGESLQLGSDKQITIDVVIENTGNYSGKEVIQLYIGQDNPSIPKPVRELKRFAKVNLEPGEIKTVQFSFGCSDLASFDLDVHDWNVETGCYTAFVGTSSRDLPYAREFVVKGIALTALNENSTVNQIASAPGGMDAIKVCCKGLPISDESLDFGLMFYAGAKMDVFWREFFVPAMEKLTDEEKQSRYTWISEQIRKLYG